ncbi:YpiF family protein [Aquibacillus rhizosphaerae]|uniref:YpiF family protein n=1 Tax=Aquibacillus rhizosphaerae TaxID=3051431 RepID=A0ABT7L4L3_9BACI|nr:YpiF family protein [Aquibacillus sp. LR5S19]MDL4840812.1 YpiF family protein [Aquibacillus sp. LR5S19]
MQWNKDDIKQYIEVTEYVDTLLIPLMPFTMNMDKQVEKIVVQGELIKIFSSELERRFKGRIFLTPSFTYLSESDKGNGVEQLNKWVEEAMDNPFKHVFFLTFDAQWKKFESKMNGNLLWFPSVQSGDLNSEATKSMIKDQISQVMELIRSYW